MEIRSHRFEETFFKNRIRLEHEYRQTELEIGPFKMGYEKATALFRALQRCLEWTGVLRRGILNCLDFEVITREISLPQLPKSLDGFRVLHLTDLHIDATPDGGKRLFEIVKDISCDLCVVTGDFRYDLFGDFEEVIKRVATLVPLIKSERGVFAILGNHDSIDMVEGLEKAGMRVLVNEGLKMEEGFFLAGVDDPHYYKTYDLKRAFKESKPEDCRLLLAHSPEIITEAHEAGAHVYLCGHSHGGQICFPRNSPIITNTHSDRKFHSGAWEYKGMKGYTSRGAGTAGLTVRYLCRPEVTVHILKSN